MQCAHWLQFAGASRKKRRSKTRKERLHCYPVLFLSSVLFVSHGGVVERRYRHGMRFDRLLWIARDWNVGRVDAAVADLNRYERTLVENLKRRFTIIIDTTIHASVGEKMENLLEMSKHKDRRRQNTRRRSHVSAGTVADTNSRLLL